MSVALWVTVGGVRVCSVLVSCGGGSALGVPWWCWWVRLRVVLCFVFCVFCFVLFCVACVVFLCFVCFVFVVLVCVRCAVLCFVFCVLFVCECLRRCGGAGSRAYFARSCQCRSGYSSAFLFFLLCPFLPMQVWQ